MRKVPSLKSDREVNASQLEDPEFRQRWVGTALARAVALRVLTYRTEHGLSQSQLARKMGMRQPAIARLEAGEHNPSLVTLQHLSRTLGIEFLVDITPVGRPRMWITKDAEQAEVVETSVAEDGSSILVAAS